MRGGRWPELKMKRSWYTLALTDSLHDGQFETRNGRFNVHVIYYHNGITPNEHSSLVWF